MRKALTIAAVLAQIGVLVAMFGEREHIARFGHLVYLRTAPLDPRDIFRGDFVRLDYEISAINKRSMSDGLEEAHFDERDYPVYAVLAQGANGLAEIDYATDVRPAVMPFIRGRLTDRWRFGTGPNAARVRYGIEQLFVQQGMGLAIEKRRGQRDDLQIPLEVAVALGGSGTAVVTGYRWSRLGVQLETLRMPQRVPNANIDEIEGPLSPLVRVTLKNVSDAPLAVVEPGRRLRVRTRSSELVGPGIPTRG